MRAEQILTSEFFGLGTTDPDTDSKLWRYHNLVIKDDRSEIEAEELENLERFLGNTMTVGDTLTEQLQVESMRKMRFDPFAPLEKVDGQTRENLVQALANLDDIETAPPVKPKP